MTTAFFVSTAIIKVLIGIGGITLIVINIVRAISKKDKNGYSKALKFFLYVFGLMALITILEFSLAGLF